MRKLLMFLVVALAAAAFFTIGGEPASASVGSPDTVEHTVPGDHTPGAEHNLCHWFRPYGVGEVRDHNRIDGQNRVCFWRSPPDSLGNRQCYYYWIRYGLLGEEQWSGPHEVQLYDFNC